MTRIEHARAHMQRAQEILSRMQHGFGTDFTSSENDNAKEWNDAPLHWPKEGNAWWYSYDVDAPDGFDLRAKPSGEKNGAHPSIYIPLESRYGNVYIELDSIIYQSPKYGRVFKGKLASHGTPRAAKTLGLTAGNAVILRMVTDHDKELVRSGVQMLMEEHSAAQVNTAILERDYDTAVADKDENELEKREEWLEMKQIFQNLDIELKTFQDVIAGGVLFRKKTNSELKTQEFGVYSEEGKLKQIWKHARIDDRTLKRLNYFDDNVSPFKLSIAHKRMNQILGRHPKLSRKKRRYTSDLNQYLKENMFKLEVPFSDENDDSSSFKMNIVISKVVLKLFAVSLTGYVMNDTFCYKSGETVDVLLRINNDGPVEGTIQQQHVSRDNQKEVSVHFTPRFLEQLKELLGIVNDFDEITNPRVQSLMSH